jgi:hypothetical protein
MALWSKSNMHWFVQGRRLVEVALSIELFGQQQPKID